MPRSTGPKRSPLRAGRLVAGEAAVAAEEQLSPRGQGLVDAQRMEHVLAAPRSRASRPRGRRRGRATPGRSEVVARHARARVEGGGVADEGQQPARARRRGDLGELGRRAVALAFDGVAGDAARLGEQPLTGRRVTRWLGGRRGDARRELGGYGLREEVMREIADVAGGELEVGHRGVGVDGPRVWRASAAASRRRS